MSETITTSQTEFGRMAEKSGKCQKRRVLETEIVRNCKYWRLKESETVSVGN